MLNNLTRKRILRTEQLRTQNIAPISFSILGTHPTSPVPIQTRFAYIKLNGALRNVLALRIRYVRRFHSHNTETDKEWGNLPNS